MEAGDRSLFAVGATVVRRDVYRQRYSCTLAPMPAVPAPRGMKTRAGVGDGA